MPKQKLTAGASKAAGGRKNRGSRGSERAVTGDALDHDWYSEENRKSYEAGDKTALLRALVHCALFRRAMPEWASQAFVLIYRAALAGEIRSWDDVFGRPWRQEKSRAQQRGVRTQSWKWEVWKLVQELHEGEGKPPIDDVLFERVGRRLGIGGKSTIKALYGQVERAVRRVRSSKR
jgi:hypothetical protein